MMIADKLAEIAENVPKVYQSGYNGGYNKGYAEGEQHGHQEGTAEGWQQGLDEGINIGKSQQYDEFWDAFQQGGNRKIYSNCFNSGCWNAETLKPKYLIKPIDETATSQYGVSMFYRANELNTNRLDFSSIADMFDFSGLTMATSLFSSAYFTNVVADLSNAHNASLAFANQWYGAVDKLMLKVSEKLTTATNIFYGNSWLSELIMMEGSVIACDGWDLHWATKLSRASIESVINALSDSTSGKSITFSSEAVGVAWGYDYEGAWSEFIATKPNWNIFLA